MADETGQGQPAAQQPPSEAELQAALEEQMRNIRVEDVIVQTTVTLVNLAARRIGLGAAPGEDVAEQRDLGQAQLAIDGARALLALCPPEVVQQIQPALSQLQMEFARVAQGEGDGPAAGGPGEGATAPEPGAAPPAGEPQPAADDERAKARAKIWTPPGT